MYTVEVRKVRLPVYHPTVQQRPVHKFSSGVYSYGRLIPASLRLSEIRIIDLYIHCSQWGHRETKRGAHPRVKLYTTPGSSSWMKVYNASRFIEWSRTESNWKRFARYRLEYVGKCLSENVGKKLLPSHSDDALLPEWPS